MSARCLGLIFFNNTNSWNFVIEKLISRLYFSQNHSPDIVLNQIIRKYHFNDDELIKRLGHNIR